MSNIFIDSKTDQAIANNLLDSNFAGTTIAGTPETDEDHAKGIVVTQRETFSADDLPPPADEASNGSSTIQQYNIPDATVFLETGANHTLGIFPVGATIRDYLSDWDFGDDVERAVGMATFGYDDEVTQADETDIDVRIWCSPNFYPGTLGASHADFVNDDENGDRTPKVFATYAEAQDWIAVTEADIYVTAHGESGRPTYTIAL